MFLDEMCNRPAALVFIRLALMAAPSRPPSLPLFFVPNVGQAGPETLFLARGQGYSIYAGHGRVALAAAQGTVRMGLDGSNPAAAVRGHDRQEGRANYLLGDRSRWRTGLPLYAGVEYRDVYPGVSLILYGNGRELEYDFLLAPGARPDRICLSFEGVKSVRVKEGDLVLETPSGQLRHRRPRIYQQLDGGRKVEIAGRFVLRGPRRAGFVLERYDKTRPLVIDPVLVYGTYAGGSGDDRAWAIAVDAAGCAYVAGETWSVNFPRTFNFSHSAGNLDAFLIKLNAAGTAVLYATYFGGAARDSARGVALDAAGNAYVTGSSSSADFPTTSGAYRTSPAGLDDAFVVKLNATGSSLLYATLLGGAGSDLPAGIAVDSSGNAYIAGYTNSLSFPVTTGAFQKNFGGGWQDAFAAKLNASGSGLVYATYLGGQGNDMANGIAVDSLGFAYIAGYTDSTNFPVVNALRVAAGGQGDGFVAKLNPAGNGLAYATYLGGAQADTVTAVAVDASGNAYVTGSTFSRDFPVTAGAFQVAGQGSVDAFVSKLNPQGNALVYSTFVGGEASEEAEAIAVDPGGIAYIAGWTDSLRFPLQTPLDAAPHGGRDAFVAALSTAGNSLSWSTYLGGAAEDRAMGIAVDPGNSVYTAGYTLSPDFRMTQGTYRTASTAGDAFVMKLSAPAANLPPSAASVTPSSGSGTTQTFTFVFSDPNGAADMNWQFVLFNQTTSGTSSCLPHYNGSGVYLLSDTGATWLGPLALGSSATLENSQCAIGGAGSSVVLSGNELTLRLAMTFKPGFAGTKNIYMQTYDRSGLDTGLQARGNWTIASAVDQPPQVISASPSSGSGTTQTFTFVFSDPNGAADMNWQFILFNQTTSGVFGCLPHYNGSGVYLLSDTGATWLGPLALGSSATLENSQCAIGGAGSSVALSGNELTLRLAMTFKPGFTGTKNIYMQTYDRSGLDTGLQARGNWTIASAVNQPPQVISVSPSSGSGTAQTFTFVFSDPNGAADMNWQFILFNQTTSGVSSCLPHYNGSGVYLLSDTGASWLGPLALGSSATLENSQCAIGGAGSSVALSGNELTLRLAMTFKSGFTGIKNIYMQTYDRSGLDTGLQVHGTWTAR